MNLCRTRREDFNSLEAFDRHRVGPHDGDRRCVDVDELGALGWTRNAGDALTRLEPRDPSERKPQRRRPLVDETSSLSTRQSSDTFSPASAWRSAPAAPRARTGAYAPATSASGALAFRGGLKWT